MSHAITMSWPALHFTNSVGVAPGSYTIQVGAPMASSSSPSAPTLSGLGCASCPPDEPWWYITPPFGPYGSAEPVPPPPFDDIAHYSWDPYANDAALSGLRGAQLGFDNPFDSWGWRHRKLIALGGFGVVGAGIIAALGALLR